MQGQFAPVRPWLDRPYAFCARLSRAGDSKQPDRPSPNHGDRICRVKRCKLHRMQRYGERFDHGAQFKGKAGRQRKEVARRKVDELAEKTRIARRTEKANVRADIVAARAAELAVVAIKSRLERGAVASLPAGNSRPAIYHRSRRLVANHHREVAGRIADRALGIAVDIAAANAHGGYANPHLSRSRRFGRPFGESELSDSDKFGFDHGLCHNIFEMRNFRQFDAGPDPFGRKFQVYFKWLQTAISIRHSDTVDVKFVLVDDNGGRSEKTIALPHADLLTVAREIGRQLDDPWCGRLAAMHLIHLVETGEDMEKNLVTVSLPELRAYAAEEQRVEREAIAAK
jgi:hypothetical protein